MTEPTPPQRPVGPYEQSLIESRSSRKALEHRAAAARRRKIIAAVLGVVLVVGAAAGGFVWWSGRADGAPTASGPTTDKCSSLTPVKLWVTSAMQSAAIALTQAYEASPSSPCIDYTVETRNPIESMIGLGQGQPNRPDGWIADSPRWLERVNATAKINAKPATSFAQSPLVIAMDPARAATLTAQPQWLELIGSDQPIRLSDPRSTTAGMLTLAAALPQLSKEQGRVVIPKLAKQAAASTDDLFAAYETKPEDAPAFPVSEADLIEHNRVSPQHRMVSVTPAEGTPPFEYALINVATDPVKADGVESIRTYLKTPEAARILARYGLRSTTSPVPMPTPKGSLGEVKIGPSPSPEQVAAATDVWQAATTDFSLLAVFDVSGSMKEKVGKSTRVAITQEAAGIALQALPASTKLGLWVFSTNIGPGGADYREIAPIAELDPAHKQRVAAAASHLSDSVGGGTGLYDTIWAAYQRASAAYDPDRVNAVVVLTDGRNDDDAGLTLDQLKANLRKAANPDKPIAITTIGIGPDVDPKVLSEISKMTFSDFYAAPSPGDMTTVLARALFDHDCKNGRCV
ncbi:von Willebrand factor A [Intrasporangium oryzae NRRL B-24470]|uniref:von Willebrand factor A n=1 Tax=Intrasporangium oryzae NRRL B-24470 TaxID=1386089 RepID=W9GAL1_9MICO|nr:substrate-binding domain-containing protein [Intrasporangium oryzae]EWT03085.1 von Willebrand factor A [Intrasporangium oryzae NRRL B-24470]